MGWLVACVDGLLLQSGKMCVCVCVRACLCVCEYVLGVSELLRVCMHVHMRAWVNGAPVRAGLPACCGHAHVCGYAVLCGCATLCLSVCLHGGLNVCLYVCMYVWVAVRQ